MKNSKFKIVSSQLLSLRAYARSLKSLVFGSSSVDVSRAFDMTIGSYFSFFILNFEFTKRSEVQ